jgi:hypothetical protein
MRERTRSLITFLEKDSIFFGPIIGINYLFLTRLPGNGGHIMRTPSINMFMIIFDHQSC